MNRFTSPRENNATGTSYTTRSQKAITISLPGPASWHRQRSLSGWDDRQITQWYNQRADCSENRLKECRSDFSGARLPCSGFQANEAYLTLSAIACNLLCLMRLLLPAAWCRKRAITFRHRLYAMTGQIVHHGWQRTLKVQPADLGLLDETLWILQNCRLP